MYKEYSFTCPCCGKKYDDIPLCFGNQYPDYYFMIPAEEREKRVELTESLCVIDDFYFHRGRLTIPIIDYHEDLIFNVWVSISKENFELRNDLWNDPKRIKQEPYFGWLQTIVPTYDDTSNIKAIAIENEVGTVPTIEIIQESHQLLYDQKNGITFKAASTKVEQILTKSHKG
jgi:hypothetical protein